MPNSDSILACADIVRSVDYDRYLSVLFAPSEKRAALFALYAFNFEVAKTAETVSDPTIGLIRLQWWREALDGIYAGSPRRHEVVEPLSDAIRAHLLPRALFDALIDAREQDLSPAPFALLSELETYADATSGNLMRLAARILGGGDVFDGRARAFGIAYAITGLLRALPHHAAARRIMLPLSEVAEAGLREEDIFAGPAHNIRILMNRMIAVAERHFGTAASQSRIPRAVLPAFLPVALVRPYLKRMKRGGFDPYREPVELSVPRKQWAMFSAILRGGL